MLDRTRKSEFIGLKFEGGFNDLLAFSGDFIAQTGYDHLRPIKAKFVFIPRDLFEQNQSLVQKFNGKVVEDVAELDEGKQQPAPHRSREQQIIDVQEATRRLRQEQHEFATNPRYR